jgi:hypothetical protein
MADVLPGGPVTVRVDGLREALRDLRDAGADAQDMAELMHQLGTLVVLAANPPVRSGALDSTVRAGRGKTKAVVRVGSRRVPYAGVIHYGWPARNIAPNPFLTEALQRQRGAVLAALDRGLGDLLADHNL